MWTQFHWFNLLLTALITFFISFFKRFVTPNMTHHRWPFWDCFRDAIASFNGYREEKTLRQVAMVVKFLDTNKPKTSLKWIWTVSNFIDLIQFHLDCQMLTKYPGVESESTVSKLRYGKWNMEKYTSENRRALNSRTIFEAYLINFIR